MNGDHAIECETCGEPLAGGGPCSRCLFKVSFSDAEEPAAEDAVPWTRLANCELLEELGRGGMGVVYRARQAGLDRIVAVKVLLRAKFAGPEERLRFHREAQTAGRLKHPGIVGILDVGEDEGVPWFSMEYVGGKNLEQLVREHPLAAREAADLTRRVAEALQYAHQHGVLHRDLKPSNILLDEEGAPRISDFGIARLVADGAAGLTRTGEGLGSPGYAAPEQAFGGATDVRTDVYGLGALLYHLLTGRPPFQGPTLDAILVQLRESDPLSPRRLNPSVPRDLETVCLKCLRKDPTRRYGSAEEVADDLARFQAGEPVRAKPPGPLGRATRWCRRRPWTAALVTTCVLLLAALVVGALAVARREHREERRTALLAEARERRAEGIGGSRARALEAIVEAWGIQASAELRNEAIACLSLADVSFEPALTSTPVPPDDTSADGTTSVRFEDGSLVVTDLTNRRESARLAGFPTRPLWCLDDLGRRIAVVRRVSLKSPCTIELRALPSGEVIGRLEHDQPVTCLDWAGELLVAGGSENRLLHVWDTAKGKLLHRFSGHQADLEAVAFRPDGQEFVSLARDGQLRVWHAGAGKEILRLTGLPEHAGPVGWSADGTFLRAGRSDGSGSDGFRFGWPRAVKVLAPGTVEPRSENIRSLHLDRDGTLAAAVDETGCRLWSLRRGRMVAHFPKSGAEWMSAALAPDGLWLAGWNTGLRRIPLARAERGWPLIGAAQPTPLGPGPLLVAMQQDGGALALTQNQEATGEDRVAVHFPASNESVDLHQSDPFCSAFSSDGKLLVTGSFRVEGARLWSLPTGAPLKELDHPGLVLGAQFTDDGAQLWLWGNRAVTRWQTADWSRSSPLAGPAPAGFTVAPDGQLAASADRRAVSLRRGSDLVEIARLAFPGHAGEIGTPSLDFSGDGQRLALHAADGAVVVWDLKELRRELAALGMDWPE